MVYKKHSDGFFFTTDWKVYLIFGWLMLIMQILLLIIPLS